jgi:hypothetical protein
MLYVCRKYFIYRYIYGTKFDAKTVKYAGSAKEAGLPNIGQPHSIFLILELLKRIFFSTEVSFSVFVLTSYLKALVKLMWTPCWKP